MLRSTAFVPAELMPDGMRIVNDWNPITYLIEAIRSVRQSNRWQLSA
ncbi:hypothetical protein BH24CHL6_BH24CHL6_11290 [soil metagenome]